MRRTAISICAGLLGLCAFFITHAYPGDDLEPIVVTKARSILDPTVSLNSADISAAGFTSALQSLTLLPIDLQAREPHGAVQTDFSLRGSTYQQAAVLLDGMRLDDPQTAHHNSDIPLTKEDIASIGLETNAIVPDAIGGAINQHIRPPLGNTAVAQLEYGQFNTRYELLSMTRAIGEWGVRVSGEEDASHGFAQDTDYAKRTATIHAAGIIPVGQADVTFGYQNKAFGAFDFYTPGLGFPSREWTETYLLNAGMRIDKDTFSIQPRILWREHWDTFALDQTGVRSTFISHHHTDVLTPELGFQQKTPFGTLREGVEFGDERIVSSTLGNHARQHESMYAAYLGSWDSHWSADLTTRVDAYGSQDPVLTGSTSLNYAFNEKHALRLSVTRTLRMPSFTELYYTDPTTVGNAALLSEDALSRELAYLFHASRLQNTSSIFYRTDSNLIDFVKHSPAQARWRAENLATANYWGVEEDVGYQATKILSGNLHYTYLERQVDMGGVLFKYGQNYATHLFSSALHADFPWGIQFLSLGYKKKPGRGGWFLLDTRLSYRINPKTEVYVSGTNLLDKEYEEIQGIVQPGRWITAGIRLTW